MNAPSVSVVVVSSGRPNDLFRCLAGLCQLSYPSFEVVVVADAASRTGVGIFARRIKLVPFEVPNISAARNAGIAHAAGEIVAFIDDDAVPEPSWLNHLIDPFADADVGMTGGVVIGRNGISLQWGARQILPDGTTEALEQNDAPAVFPAAGKIAAKTEGTNMAVRRSVLERLQGFDEAFAFYLDETDLNLRVRQNGHAIALVPLARVHHGFAASQRRTTKRVPTDLFEIGASIAVFQRKHDIDRPKASARLEQRQRLLRHMVAGDLLPGEVGKLLRGFDRGWTDGSERRIGQSTPYEAASEFKPVNVSVSGHTVISARFWRRRSAMQKAVRYVEQGTRVSLYLWSLSIMRHRVWFDPQGFWVQQGGQFGKSNRSDPTFAFWTSGKRLQREVARVAILRKGTD